MKVKVLGTGCAKCKRLYDEVEKAAALTGIPVEIEKVERVDEIMKYDVMRTPALVVEEEVKVSGRVAPAEEIAELLKRWAAV